LVQSFQQGVSAVIIPTEGLVKIDLDPGDIHRGVRELKPAVLEELIEQLLIVDGKVQARSSPRRCRIYRRATHPIDFSAARAQTGATPRRRGTKFQRKERGHVPV
jgi:hypothetical protein